MSSPVAARVAVNALGMAPRNYGHLVMMAARYARERLDGHAVVNRQTGAAIKLDWERGLKNATAPGMPPLLLLAVPAIPAMLAAARYLRALAPRPPHPPHVLRYHAFAATAEIAGRRIKAVLIVQEDRQHRLFLDRVLGGEVPPQWDVGGANPATPNPIPAADAAASAVATTAPLGEQSIAGSAQKSAMALPAAARVAGDALGMTPRSYGHLIQMAARYARFRLDGRSVVNHETRAPIMLAWSRGLENVTAPGMPPVLMLAVPAIPAMVAAAHYIGAFTRPSPPPDVVRYHAFAAAVDVAGRRVNVALIVRENRRGMLFLDRAIGHVAVPRRQQGGANPNDTSVAPPGAPQDIAPTENSGDDNSADDHDPAEDNGASGERTATAGAVAPLAASNGDDHDWLTRQVIGANDWFSRQTQPLRDFLGNLRAPPGPNDPPPTPKDELGLFPSRVFPGGDAPTKADGTIVETPDRKAASDALEKRRQELATSGVDPKTDPEYRRLQVAKSRADMNDIDDAALMFTPFAGGKGLAGLVERGMSRIGGAGEGAPIAGSGATTSLAKVPPAGELPPSSSGVKDATPAAATPSTPPPSGGAPAPRLASKNAAGVPSAQDLERAIGDLPEEEQNGLLARVVRGDNKGRAFGSPEQPRFPTVEEFNPRIEEIRAGDLGKVVTRTKHGIDPRQAGPVSQLSNEDLVRFRLQEPISATRGENGLSLTGGHHRTAEIISRVNAGTLDPNTPVRILVHD
jgi:hypothetical protein